MNETDAIVVRIEGDHAWVRTSGAGHACGACARKEGCRTAGSGSALLDGALGEAQTTRLLRLPNDIGARPGDAVVIRAADGAVMTAVWRAYGLPLLLGLGGATFALELSGSEALAIGGMLFGLGGGFALLRHGWFAKGKREPILSLGFKKAS